MRKHGVNCMNMGMRKLFVTREDESFFTVADIFGYVIAFFVLWLLILGYRAVSKVTSTASALVTVQVEAVKESLPLDKEVKSTLTVDKEVKGEEPNASLIPELSNKALDFVSHTSNSASKLLSKEGAKDTLFSINSYLNGLIYSVSDDVEDLKSGSPNEKSRSTKEDELSSF